MVIYKFIYLISVQVNFTCTLLFCQMRLMGAVLLGRNDVISTAKCIFKTETYRELIGTDLSEKLVEVAEEQRRLLAA